MARVDMKWGGVYGSGSKEGCEWGWLFQRPQLSTLERTISLRFSHLFFFWRFTFCMSFFIYLYFLLYLSVFPFTIPQYLPLYFSLYFPFFFCESPSISCSFPLKFGCLFWFCWQFTLFSPQAF